MTVRQILNVFKRENFADRNELAEAGGVSRNALCNMSGRNDMKLSLFLKIVQSQGFKVYMTDGFNTFDISDLEDHDDQLVDSDLSTS